ncbi:Uncharacterized protein FWK35_00034211 [Aphis craccivora]|uniref:Uncharacterized protein n=1 Tax=Aphis craccivora TaxID=307492 RepID=A0A6G0YYT4_APHCR|nr:Uncharacterized protein FWK35_00034211 [Aphis craccivora]
MSDKNQAINSIQQLEAKNVSRSSSVPPKEPTTVPGPSGSAFAPFERTKARVTKKRMKFQNMNNKKKARKLMACEQHGLAKYPNPTLDPEAANKSPQPTPPVAMEVDLPVTKGITSDVLVPFTSQEQPQQEPKEPKWLSYLNQIFEDK